ncbi:PDZ domain-containing protein [Polaribacter sp. IC063]|uniref:PDZ domain-containing protein n=1 Tax=unclassified Polaribacter TaxID=196858 RepID=UPI00397AF475
MPDYKTLFASVGVSLEQKETKSDFESNLNGINISGNPKIGSSIYKAKLQKGDTILSINNINTKNDNDISSTLKKSNVGDEITISFKRYGVQKTTKLILQKNETYSISAIEKENLSAKILKNRENWLSAK